MDIAADLIHTDRTRVIQRSLRCFHFGLIGLVPVIGVVPALLAIASYHQCARDIGDTWQPKWLLIGWLIPILYVGIYTYSMSLDGFALMILVGAAIQIAAIVEAWRHQDYLAWNPARRLAILGLAMAYSGLACIPIGLQAWLAYLLIPQYGN